MQNVSPERLRQIRLARGLSLDELAERMGDLVTKQALSKYETNGAQPRPRTLARLAKALSVSTEMLMDTPPFTITFAFRHCRPSCAAMKRKAMESRMHIAIEQRVRLQEALHPGDRPELPIMAFEVEATEGVEAAAEALRDRMRLGRDPIACVLAALEAQGVHVLQWRAADGFEGLSALVRDNHGRNIGAGIAVRADIDGESQRFTAAHEAGHLFLKIAPHLKVEGVCDRFARALLVPAETLREEVGPIRTRILLPELLLLKGRFGIGVPALIVRLFETGIIRRHYARQMFEAIERHGWRVQAPDPLPAERPIRFLQSVQRAEAEKLITPREAAELLNEAEGIAPLEARPDFMSEAGQRATDMARAELRAKGIAPVIWRDGETVEEGE